MANRYQGRSGKGAARSIKKLKRMEAQDRQTISEIAAHIRTVTRFVNSASEGWSPNVLADIHEIPVGDIEWMLYEWHTSQESYREDIEICEKAGYKIG